MINVEPRRPNTKTLSDRDSVSRRAATCLCPFRRRSRPRRSPLAAGVMRPQAVRDDAALRLAQVVSIADPPAPLGVRIRSHAGAPSHSGDLRRDDNRRASRTEVPSVSLDHEGLLEFGDNRVDLRHPGVEMPAMHSPHPVDRDDTGRVRTSCCRRKTFRRFRSRRVFADGRSGCPEL